MIFGIPLKDVAEFLIAILNTILVFLTRRQSILNTRHLEAIERHQNDRA